MGSNGAKPTPHVRVLLSGPAATEVEATLATSRRSSVIRRRRGRSLGGRRRRPRARVLLRPRRRRRGAAACASATSAPFILAAYGEPNGIVETGLAIGAADVLVLPQSAETLVFALRKAARAAAGTSTGKVVTVFSPKGGSGKTVLATNLAVAAARSGVKTLLVDLDLQFGDSALDAGADAAGDDRRPRGFAATSMPRS